MGFRFRPSQFSVSHSRVIVRGSSFGLSNRVSGVHGCLGRHKFLRNSLSFISGKAGVSRLVTFIGRLFPSSGRSSRRRGANSSSSGISFTGTGTRPIPRRGVSPRSRPSPFVIPHHVGVSLGAGVEGTVFGSASVRGLGKQLAIHSKVTIIRRVNFAYSTTRVRLANVCHSSHHGRLFYKLSFRLLSVSVTRLVGVVPSVSAVIPVLGSFRNGTRFRVTTRACLFTSCAPGVSALHTTTTLRKGSLILVSDRLFSAVSGCVVFGGGAGGLISSLSIRVAIFHGRISVCPFLVSVSG